jgi:hypothetical protein
VFAAMITDYDRRKIREVVALTSQATFDQYTEVARDRGFQLDGKNLTAVHDFRVFLEKWRSRTAVGMNLYSFIQFFAFAF